MKKWMIILLSMLMCLAWLPVQAEDPMAALTPFMLTLPQDVTARANAGGTSVTFMHGNGMTRVVAMVLDRVPDEKGDHAAELTRLMGQFAPDAGEHTPLTLSEGFYGLMAVTPYALEGVGSDRVDQVTVMVLWQTPLEGELLILSGYDMAGDTARARTMVEVLLKAVTVNGTPVVPPVTEMSLPEE